MRKIKAFLLTIALVLTISVPAYAQEYDGYTVESMEPVQVYVNRTINLRDLPTSEGNLLGTLHEGDMPIVVGKVTSNRWNDYPYYVLDNGAFLNGHYFTFDVPKTVILDVQNILQNPELPNGCEVTSLAICLNYKGYAVDKCDLSDNYLPKTTVWNEEYTSEAYYLGNPRSKGGADSGWYCFATCLSKTIDNYNAANNTAITYGNLTGSDVSSLYAEIDNGNPVVIWGTLRWGTPRAYANGYYRNLHCMVLSGYSDSTVTITDPIYGEGLKTIKRSTFETVWSLMGNHALVIY